MKVESKDILFVIPARGGSKRLPKKNILPLNGKPLVCYSIDTALQIVDADNVCVSTDSDEIIKVVEKYGLHVPFKRPDDLASDTATTNDVLVHAVNYFKERGKDFKLLVLLQATSPLRKKEDVINAIGLVDNSCDMVVSVRKSHAAVVMCHEDENGYLKPTLKKQYGREQDFQGEYYEFNGSIYVMKVDSLLDKGMSNFNRKKYVMSDLYSTDIDTEEDFIEAEARLKYLEKKGQL